MLSNQDAAITKAATAKLFISERRSQMFCVGVFLLKGTKTNER